MSDRTDFDKLSAKGVQITLGGKQYEIVPLKLRKARAWKKKVADFVNPLFATNVDDKDNLSMLHLLKDVLLSRQAEVEDLFFEYCENLPKEEILDESDEAELFNVIVNDFLPVAFPLVKLALGQPNLNAIIQKTNTTTS